MKTNNSILENNLCPMIMLIVWLKPINKLLQIIQNRLN